MPVVYLHKRNDTNEIFYVGIGRNKRRAYTKDHRTQHWHNIVSKVGYIVDLLVSETSWEDACKIEKLLIEKYGRKDLGLGNLVNFTDGGEGNFGLLHSEETKQKISKSSKGKSAPNKGVAMSEKTKQKISKTMKGISRSEETRQKMSEALKGRKKSPEHIAKYIASRKANKLNFPTNINYNEL